MNSLAGYQRTSGLGCGIDTQCGCAGLGGLGDLLNPATWGPADWLVAIVGGFTVWHLYKGNERRKYRKIVRRRIREVV